MMRARWRVSVDRSGRRSSWACTSGRCGATCATGGCARSASASSIEWRARPLDALTGRAAAPPAAGGGDRAGARHVEVSASCRSRRSMRTRRAASRRRCWPPRTGRRDQADPLRIDTIYDPARARLKVILNGSARHDGVAAEVRQRVSGGVTRSRHDRDYRDPGEDAARPHRRRHHGLPHHACRDRRRPRRRDRAPARRADDDGGEEGGPRRDSRGWWRSRSEGERGAIVEVNCETDFVARERRLPPRRVVARRRWRSPPAGDSPRWRAAPSPDGDGRVADLVTRLSARTGEHVAIRRVARRRGAAGGRRVAVRAQRGRRGHRHDRRAGRARRRRRGRGRRSAGRSRCTWPPARRSGWRRPTSRRRCSPRSARSCWRRRRRAASRRRSSRRWWRGGCASSSTRSCCCGSRSSSTPTGRWSRRWPGACTPARRCGCARSSATASAIRCGVTFFPGFERRAIETSGATIHTVWGGSGPPLLLLHGSPQTHVMWHKVAPRLAAVVHGRADRPARLRRQQQAGRRRHPRRLLEARDGERPGGGDARARLRSLCGGRPRSRRAGDVAAGGGASARWSRAPPCSTSCRCRTR